MSGIKRTLSYHKSKIQFLTLRLVSSNTNYRIAIVFITNCVLSAVTATALSGAKPAVESAGMDEVTSTALMGARCIGASFDDTAAFQAAIDTGRTVYAPRLGGLCHLTKPLIFRTPGQIFYGDGLVRTQFAISQDFRGDGVFVGVSAPPGPTLRDFSILFEQPDTGNRSELTHYGAAFSFPNLPGFQLSHIGCFRATVCVDMKGNTGGSTIEDFAFDAFDIGIDIDGALDTVRLVGLHWWPFALTPLQQVIFYSQGADRPIGLQVGRADDLKITGGLFLGGLGIHFYKGKQGASFGNIVATDFDALSGIKMEAGVMTVAASTFTIGAKDGKLIDQSGGVLTIATSHFHIGTALQAQPIALSGGSLSISSSFFELNTFDNQITTCGDRSVFTSIGNVFHAGAVLVPKKPLLSLEPGCLYIVSSNIADAPFYDHRVFAKTPRTSEGLLHDNVLRGWRVEQSN